MKSTTSDYLILKELGKGSFGKVFLGENHRGSQRAIKILLRRGKNDDKRRFERECMIHSQLNGHPNIVRYYGCFENQNMMGMLMEVLVGGNLRDELKRRKRFEEYQVISMIRSLLRAIEFMHSKFIAHRDIKLENILIACNSRTPIVKLGDFGLARFAWFESGLGDGAGSPPYMAPEVFSDNGYGRPVDMWALGVVTYTLLSGRLPFGNNESTKDKILTCQFNFDGKVWNRISSTAKSFIRQLFNPDPSQRLTAEMALSHSWLIEGSGLTASPFSRSSDELMEDFQNNEILDLLAIDSTHSEDVDLTDIDYVEKIEKDHHLSRPPLKRKASKKNLSEGKCMKIRESP